MNKKLISLTLPKQRTWEEMLKIPQQTFNAEQTQAFNLLEQVPELSNTDRHDLWQAFSFVYYRLKIQPGMKTVIIGNTNERVVPTILTLLGSDLKIFDKERHFETRNENIWFWGEFSSSMVSISNDKSCPSFIPSDSIDRLIVPTGAVSDPVYITWERTGRVSEGTDVRTMSNPRDVIREAVRVIKNEGILALGSFGRHGQRDWVGHEENFALGFIKEVLQEANMSHVSIEKLDSSYWEYGTRCGCLYRVHKSMEFGVYENNAAI